MSKEPVSSVQHDVEFYQRLFENFKAIADENKKPLAAIDRLATSAGRVTIKKLMETIHEDWYAEQPKPQIVVPDLPARRLTALVAAKLKLNHKIGEDLRTWDYYRDQGGSVIPGRGKRYEVLVWNPKLRTDQSISGAEVRDHFDRLGFHGHVGAFMQWLRVTKCRAYYTTVPEDRVCLREPHSYCTPSFEWNEALPDREGFEDGFRTLALHSTYDWTFSHMFVAFRELLTE